MVTLLMMAPTEMKELMNRVTVISPKAVEVMLGSLKMMGMTQAGPVMAMDLTEVTQDRLMGVNRQTRPDRA
jgi:hypothetical protein